MDKQYSYKIIECEWITLTSGIKLAARLWLPQETQTDGTSTLQVPAVLEYLPYRRRDGTSARDVQTYDYFAKRGIAGVRVDIRGNGDSEGLMDDEYTPTELEDANQVIAWIAKQAWCNGHVGMMGISWGGFNALQVAASQPPALKAVIAVAATDNRYSNDIHFKGGCITNCNILWVEQMLAICSRPPDPEIVGEKWQEIWLARLKEQPLLANNWLGNILRNDYWRHGSVGENYQDLTIPVLSIGGWADITYKDPVMRLKKHLKERCYGIIGPWEHAYPHIAKNTPNVDFLGIACDWWHSFLTDSPAASWDKMHVFIEKYTPPTRHYAARNGFWIDANLDNITVQPLFLSADRALVAELSQENATIDIQSPLNHGVNAGTVCAGMRLDQELADNQQQDDAMAETFDGQIWDEDTVIFGNVEFSFEVASNDAQANIIARLCEVDADGNSQLITWGALNLNHDKNNTTSQPLEVGKYYSYQLELDVCGHQVTKGNFLRLSLSNQYWPVLWPNAQDNMLTLKLDTARLNIPVLRDYQTINMPAPQPEFQDKRVAVRQTALARNSSDENGLSVITIDADFGAYLDPITGIEMGSKVQESFTIQDGNPLSAHTRSAFHHTLKGNNGWDISTDTHVEMKSDAEYFLIEARLEAFVKGESVFVKNWQEKIRRH